MPFNRENSDQVEIRPRFKLISKMSPDEIISRIRLSINLRTDVKGRVVRDHIFIKIPNEEQHYWSPELDVYVEEHEELENRTLIRCIVGPNQTIWGIIFIAYIALGVVTFFGGIAGLVLWNRGESSWLIWSAPIAILLAGFVYFIVKMGQKRGRDQMLHLVSVLYHAIDDETLERH